MTLYLLLFVAALGVCGLASIVRKPDMRACPGCADAVAIQARHCRHCGYRFR